MRLQRLGVTNFRNLAAGSDISLPPRGLLVVAAPNAAGKTNFLESIVVLLRGRSFRARLEDCVAWGSDSFVLFGDVQGSETVRVAVRYHQGTRRLRVEQNGEPASLVPFYSRYPLVLFIPDDTFLFTRGPATRRSFLNQLLVGHTPYLSSLVQYHRVLRQRNIALKVGGRAGEVEAWTELLVEQAAVLWRHRETAVQFLATRVAESYASLTGERRAMTVRFMPGSQMPERFAGELAAQAAVEQRSGYTLTGPHRDDFMVLADGRPVVVALSRGQMRGLVLSLKVLMSQYLAQIAEEEPLLLLDDALSELDERRQVALLDSLPVAAQVFLTCTRLPRTVQRANEVYVLDLRELLAAKVRRGEAVAVR